MNTIIDILSRSPGALTLDIAAKSTLVLALAGAAALLLRRAPAAARHLAWCLGLCGAMALPVMALGVPGWTWPVPPAHEMDASFAPTASIPRTLPSELALPTASPAQPLDRSIAATASVRFPTRESAPDQTAPPTQTWTPTPGTWLAATWSIVTMLILAVPMIGRFALGRLARGAQPIHEGEWNELLRELSEWLGLSRRVTLLQSQHALMPMTWGSLRPVILLPADADSWPVDRRRDVLVHELAHIKRLDCLTQAVAPLACALYWFNPLAWIASRRLRIERERACDDMVLLAGSRASDYAAHLLDLARSLRSRQQHSFAALAMARPSHLEGRLLSILDAGCPRRGVNRPAVVLGLIAMAGIILPLAVVRLGVRTAEAGTVTREDRVQAEPRRTVNGRVIDEHGKPIADAQVALLSDRKQRVSDEGDAHLNQLMSTTTTDADGRFRVAFAPSPEAELTALRAIAAAPGRGFDGNELKADVVDQETTITLDPERAVEGRLVDVQGQAAAGVGVRIKDLNIRWRAYSPYDSKGGQSLWPSTATTDRDGRFRLLGLGDRAAITLEIDDPRFARQSLAIAAGDEGRTKPKTMSLVPAQAIEVRVIRADDGKPMAGARVSVRAEQRNRHSWSEEVSARADDQGRVRIAPWPSDAFRITAYPREGEPYLRREASLDWPKGAVQQAVEVKLKRGVVVHGKLTEEPSGAPVPGASILYIQTHRNNPLYDGSYNLDTLSGPDGTFEVVVPRGPGDLLVQGPSGDFIHVPTSHGELGTSWRPDNMLYPDALAHLDIKPDEATHAIAMRLRRGVTVVGRAIGPDGQPIAEAFAKSRALTPYFGHRLTDLFFTNSGPGIGVRDGRFEIPGFDPAKSAPFHFLDVKHQLGATAEISARSDATGPITVKFQPCGSARVLLKDAGGKPLANHPADAFAGDMILIVTPGADLVAMNSTGADKEFQVNLEPGRNRKEPLVNMDLGHNRNLRTGPDGRVTFVSLIPGATYQFRGHEFTAEPGKTIDLPDITVEGSK